MQNFQRISQGLNMVPLSLELARQPELWERDTYIRDFPGGPFPDVETIFLRFPPASHTEEERAQRDEHESVWMDGALHLPAARPFLYALMSQVAAERLGRVMINKLAPGGRILPHPDTPSHAEYYDRFHFVVQGMPGVKFRCGGETINPLTGECWWFQHKLEHEVLNNSADDRIHLIVDLRLQHLEFRGELPTKPVPKEPPQHYPNFVDEPGAPVDETPTAHDLIRAGEGA